MTVASSAFGAVPKRIKLNGMIKQCACYMYKSYKGLFSSPKDPTSFTLLVESQFKVSIILN